MISPFYLDLTEQEIEDIQHALGEILNNGTLILGKYTRSFESEFANYTDTKYAISLNSGTSALEILLTAYRTKGKRIAVASNTNFATVAAIIRAGGTPIYMDMTSDYFVPNIDILKFTVDKYNVGGVAWVHIGGIIAPDFLEVVEFCKSKNIFLIEDAAHAHGSAMNGIKAGAFADGGAFSFFPTKVMTTIEGGMITTNDEELADFARSMRNQGKRGGDYGGLHHDLGYSWRMSEISAYIGLVQLKKLDAMVSIRSMAAESVAVLLEEMNVNYCSTKHMDSASNYKFIIHLTESMNLEDIKSKMKEQDVNCGGGVYEVPCHQQPVFNNVPYNLDELLITEKYCSLHICPPITSGTSKDNIVTINNVLKKIFV